MINLRCRDIELGTGAHISCEGKGRKQRCTPLRRDTVKTIEAWFKERAGSDDDPVFPTIRGDRLSRDAVEHIVRKYTVAASKACASLIGKRVSPHVLRHSTAMELLQNGVDRTVIALWLGHESVETTQVYMHADKHEDDLSGPLAQAIEDKVNGVQTGDVTWDYSVLTHRRSGEEGVYGADLLTSI